MRILKKWWGYIAAGLAALAGVFLVIFRRKSEIKPETDISGLEKYARGRDKELSSKMREIDDALDGVRKAIDGADTSDVSDGFDDLGY